MKVIIAIVVVAMGTTMLVAKERTRCQSSVTGKFVTQAFAKANPSTTFCGRVPMPRVKPQ